MKAKRNISKKGKRLESLKVEPSKQPAAQPNKEDPAIDLREFPALFAVNDILEKLYRPPRPSVVDCEDESRNAYRKGSALLVYADLADVGLDAEGSTLPEPIATHLVESIQLQLDIVRLASQRLFFLCQPHNSRESGDSRESDDSHNS